MRSIGGILVIALTTLVIALWFEFRDGLQGGTASDQFEHPRLVTDARC